MTVTMEYELNLGDMGNHVATALCTVSRNMLNEMALDIERVVLVLDGLVLNALPFIPQDKLIEMRIELKNRYWCEMMPMLKSAGEIVV